VELHQLQCFVLVLEEGGFKRATARLRVTQPALSYQIKQLEEELGVQLFYRRADGITPTEAGRVLLQHAYQVISAVHEAHQAVRELSHGVSGEIRVGTVNSVGTYFLPHVLRGLRAGHPAVRATLLYRRSDELLDALLENKLDVALVAEPRPDRSLRCEPVFEERISLVTRPGHALFGRASVSAAELDGERFVVLSPQTPTGALIRDYLARLGVSVEPVISTDNVETVKRMVEAGMGVALLPDMVTDVDVEGDGAPERLGRSALDPPLGRRVVLAAWRDSPHSRAVEAFVDEVHRHARTWRG
jgi:DNA-binding transcriptional LysR family regulator